MSAAKTPADAPSDPVRTEDRDGIRIVALDRPPVNAVDLETIRRLGEVVAAAEADSSCSAVVITGHGAAFSAGLDLKKLPAYDAAARAEMIRTINRTLLALYGLPKPTVAAINGHVFAAGFILALACDVRYAATGTYKLGITEVGAGVPFPAAPLVVLQAELEPSAARSLVLTGRTFAPSDPVTARFVDAFFAPEALLDAAVAEALSASKRSAYAAVKQQLKATALARMKRIVDEDADPLLGAWF